MISFIILLQPVSLTPAKRPLLTLCGVFVDIASLVSEVLAWWQLFHVEKLVAVGIDGLSHRRLCSQPGHILIFLGLIIVIIIML